jgi:hypothetical protein
LSGKSNSLFGDWTVFVDVLSWYNLVFTLGEAVINMLGDRERFFLE